MPKIQYYKEGEVVLMQDRRVGKIEEVDSSASGTYYMIRIKGVLEPIQSGDIVEKVKLDGDYSNNEVVTNESTLDTMFCELEPFLSEKCCDLFTKFQNKMHEELKELGFECI